jgi:hypothetical protein
MRPFPGCPQFSGRPRRVRFFWKHNTVAKPRFYGHYGLADTVFMERPTRK